MLWADILLSQLGEASYMSALDLPKVYTDANTATELWDQYYPAAPGAVRGFYNSQVQHVLTSLLGKVRRAIRETCPRGVFMICWTRMVRPGVVENSPRKEPRSHLTWHPWALDRPSSREGVSIIEVPAVQGKSLDEKSTGCLSLHAVTWTLGLGS